MALRVERRPNQVGGGGPMPNRIVDTNANIHPEWLKLMTDHQDRLVIGSDEFVGPSGKEPKGAASYTDTWAMVSRLPPDIAAKIGRENALRIYNLR
jgi:predicted TIM-barrel fold metal-dependent hydrolase